MQPLLERQRLFSMILRRIVHISAVADESFKTKKRNRALAFLKRLYARVRDDDVPALGAQFAYHLLFALFPFLLFLAALISFVPVSQERALGEFASIVPDAAREVVQRTLSEISGGKRADILSLSMLTAIFLASNGFAAVTRGLNKAYGVPETRGFIRVRLLSLLFVPLIALGILLEVVTMVFGKVLLCRISEALCWSPAGTAFFNALRFALPFLTMILIFTLIYAVTPNRRLTFRQALPGAVFASAAWAAASLAFSFYVNRFANYSRLYGSLGGVLILLFWLYITSVVLLAGSEINAELYFEKRREKINQE